MPSQVGFDFRHEDDIRIFIAPLSTVTAVDIDGTSVITQCAISPGTVNVEGYTITDNEFLHTLGISTSLSPYSLLFHAFDPRIFTVDTITSTVFPISSSSQITDYSNGLEVIVKPQSSSRTLISSVYSILDGVNLPFIPFTKAVVFGTSVTTFAPSVKVRMPLRMAVPAGITESRLAIYTHQNGVWVQNGEQFTFDGTTVTWNKATAYPSVLGLTVPIGTPRQSLLQTTEPGRIASGFSGSPSGMRGYYWWSNF